MNSSIASFKGGNKRVPKWSLLAVNILLESENTLIIIALNVNANTWPMAATPHHKEEKTCSKGSGTRLGRRTANHHIFAAQKRSPCEGISAFIRAQMSLGSENI